jgi:hypothetical protein
MFDVPAVTHAVRVELPLEQSMQYNDLYLPSGQDHGEPACVCIPGQI